MIIGRSRSSFTYNIQKHLHQPTKRRKMITVIPPTGPTDSTHSRSSSSSPRIVDQVQVILVVVEQDEESLIVPPPTLGRSTEQSPDPRTPQSDYGVPLHPGRSAQMLDRCKINTSHGILSTP
ncbi:hypothetical protein PGT21_024159 [Puccinia graminis f. sp. tritici]|uniref:Uncharacterized protein n=1 Tax=Puccinia graminis f. sp. tritici TaxID=56615 RepID=A0A5B0MUF9_PUCGR|nr:hypothetical protein PGT21_024159 [Puccinia graminis f. sp. tritici]